jgi:hypothetical protein
MIEIAIEDSFQNKIYQDLYYLQTLTISKLWAKCRDCNIIQAARHCCLKLSPIKLPQCLYALSITATQPTNGFVDLRKPTSNSGNNLLITDFQVLKNQTFTINYKVVQSGMEANKSAIVTIENQF